MLKRFTPIIALTGACWLILAVNSLVWGGRLAQYGITPRHVGGLPGIIWAPFLHGSLQHLAANTLPLLILGGILCARGKGEFGLVTAAGILLGGGLTWLLGRNATHIGASGLIFCYFGYLASLALFDRNFFNVALSIVCILAYGGMLRGIMPTAAPISWESHATGLIAGITLAWFVTRVRKTPLGPMAEPIGKLPGG